MEKQRGIGYRLLFQYFIVSYVFMSIMLLTPLTDCFGFRNIKEGEKAPGFTLKDLDGKAYSLGRAYGKIAILLYWRPGQERSHEALKQLGQISTQFRGQSVQIFAITKDVSKKSEIIKIKKKMGISFPVLLDTEGKVYGSFGVFVFPSTAIIDQKGIFRYQYAGFREDYQDELSSRVKLLLGLITQKELKQQREKKLQEITEKQKKAMHHLNLGKLLKKRGMEEKAFEEFQKAVEFDPDNPESQVLLGFAMIDAGNIDKAKEHFQKAIEIDRLSSDAKIGLGIAYRMKGQTEKALSVLQEALRLCPDSARMHFELGKIYEGRGNLKEAVRHYRESAENLLKME